MVPLTVVAGPPAPVDFLEAFKHKLSLVGINRPDASTISRLLQFHPQHMFMMAKSSACTVAVQPSVGAAWEPDSFADAFTA